MTHLADHAAQRWAIFLFNGFVDFTETERIKCPFLVFRRTDAALRLCYFDRCHSRLSSEYFFHRNTALLCDSACITHLAQGQNCCLNQVVGVRRTFGLGQHVLYTHTLKHCTHRATGYDTSTGRGWHNQHFCTAEACCLFVRYSTINHRHFNQILFRSLHAFGDSGGNFTGFSKAVTDDSISVADNDNCGKGKGAATFSYLDYAIDSNQSIF